MNKRMKKKHELLEAVQEARNGQAMLSETICNVLMCVEHDKQGQVKLAQQVDELEKIHSQNTLATNNRFDQLEAENKAIRDELAGLKQQLKAKKSWFSRK